MIGVVPRAMVRGSQDFLKGARASMTSDPTSLRLMRATKIKEPA